MLAEVVQSEGSPEVENDSVYQIMFFTLYRSANWKCPKCGKNSPVFFSPVLQFSAFCILIPTYEFKSQKPGF